MPLSSFAQTAISSNDFYGEKASVKGALFFEHKDWDVICDNSLTCRAIGMSDEVSDNYVAILLTRNAGANTKTIVELVFSTSYTPESGKPILIVDSKSLGEVQNKSGHFIFDYEQQKKFLVAMENNSIIEIGFDKKKLKIPISSYGSNAVLRKIDDVQGRNGTLTALIAKGERDVSQVYMPRMIPQVSKRKALDERALNIDHSEIKYYCEDENLLFSAEKARLDFTTSLTILRCANETIWFIHRNKPESVLDEISSADKASFNYNDGVLNIIAKGFSFDSMKEYSWDGKTLTLISEKWITNKGRGGIYIERPLFITASVEE